MAAQPEGYKVLILAEHFGVLPDVIENEMSEFWFNRAWEYLEGVELARPKPK
jgi:hypothetical protein